MGTAISMMRNSSATVAVLTLSLFVGCGGSETAQNGGPVIGSNEADAPAAPTSLEAAAAGSTEIELSWIDSADNEDEYRVEIKTGNGAFDSFRTLPKDSIYLRATQLEADTTYTFRIVARNDAGDSEPSNQASATTEGQLNSPQAPSGLTATGSGTSRIDLAWIDNSDNELDFTVEKSTDGSAYGVLATRPANSTQYSDYAVSTGILYCYRVKASNSSGSSNYSASACLTLTTQGGPPAAPSNLIATATHSSEVHLTWTRNSTNEHNFVVSRKIGNNAWATLSSTLPPGSTSYTDNSGLSGGITVQYRVAAENNSGPSTWAYSNFVNTLEPPTDLAGVVRFPETIDLSWSYNTAAQDDFVIERKVGNNGSWVIIRVQPGNARSYSDSSVSGETSYYYRIRARNQDAISDYAYSPEVYVPTNEPNDVPPQPTNFIAQPQEDPNRVELTWEDNATPTDPNNETHFEIWRKDVAFDDYTQDFIKIADNVPADPVPGEPGYVDHSVAYSSTYTYYVVAVNSLGSSDASNWSEGTTAFPPEGVPQAPSNLTATYVGPHVRLTWTDHSDDENLFVLHRKEVGGSFTTRAFIPALPGTGTTGVYDDNVSSGKVYIYRIKARANQDSDWSNETDPISIP